MLADDSGLEVDALNGAPGVHSARFAALDKSRKLARRGQQRQAAAPAQRRAAGKTHGAVPLRHRAGAGAAQKIENASPVCFADEFDAQIFDGACEGKIQFSASGQGGFGYDPLFVPDGFAQSFAELGEDVKNKLSHRAKALEKLKAFLPA